MARPTKYRQEYCEMLIQHMSKGYSVDSFGGVVKTCEKTLYNWFQEHPEFLQAQKEGLAQSRLWWESQCDKGLWNEKDAPTLNTTLWIFNMKNRFKWTDRHEITKDVKDMDEDEFNALAEKVVERIKNGSRDDN